MASSSYKAPPALNDKITYENWKKEIQVWQMVTTLNANKQAPAIFLTLQGKAREAILELDIATLAADDGVTILTGKLDDLFLSNKEQSAYAAYEKFEKFCRPAHMNVNDYIIEFERLYTKC